MQVKPQEREKFTNGITEPDAKILLQEDVGIAERGVLRLISVPLTDGQFGALVSFTFNLGAGSLQHSTLRSKVNRQEHEEVPVEFMKWVWGGGRKLAGLIKRRGEESILYSKVMLPLQIILLYYHVEYAKPFSLQKFVVIYLFFRTRKAGW